MFTSFTRIGTQTFNSISHSIKKTQFIVFSEKKDLLLDFLCSEEDYVKVPLPIKLFYALSYYLITSKCGKNKQVALEPEASLSLMCLPHFDVMRDLVLNRPTATWNLFVLTEACNPEAYNFVAMLGFFTC